MIREEQRQQLNQYKDKAYINAILAEESNNYYPFIKNITSIPLIICNSVTVCINAIIEDENTLNILNVILNSSTGFILGLISNFIIYEKIN
jgi:hypothetical protein